MNLQDHPEITVGETFATGTTRLDLKRRILACLRERLRDLPEIHVTVIGNTAAVRGVLRSTQEKRLCLECCRHVPGVARIVDELIVHGPGFKPFSQPSPLAPSWHKAARKRKEETP